MTKYVFFFLIILCGINWSCSQKTAVRESDGQPSLDEKLSAPKQKLIYIWTTWCGPCRHTLTEVFPEVSSQIDTTKYEVILIAASKNEEQVKKLALASGFAESSYMLEFSGPDVALFHKLAISNFLEEHFPNANLWQNAVPVFFLVDEENKVVKKRLPNVSAEDIWVTLKEY